MNVSSLTTIPHEVTSLSRLSSTKVECPSWPAFVKQDIAKWIAFTACLQIETQNKLPLGRCQNFSAWLYLFLAASFNGHLSPNNVLSVTVDGRLAEVIPRETHHCFEGRHFTNHYYLELKFAPFDVWIIDPTWKQFVHKREGSRHTFFPDDPFNQMVMNDFPDIMIAKRPEFFRFLQAHGDSIRLRDSYSSLMIIDSINYWANTSDDRQENFAQFVAICSKGIFDEIANWRYCIDTLSKLWSNIDSTSSLQEFCSKLLPGQP